jgi:hypothetical protein
MAQLTGNPIQNSYLGLLKTTDNAAIGGTAKAITDGSGNATNIEMSNTATNFVSGTVDFTGSTVSGLPGGAGTNFVGSYWTLNQQASSDIVYETLTIPGGTYGVGDVINVQEIEYRDGLNNWGYSSLWLSDTQQTVGQAPAGGSGNFSLAQVQSPSSRYRIIYNKTLFITSAGTFVMPVQQSEQTTGSGGDPVEIYNINWANNQYFFFQLWNDSTQGSYQVSGVSITQRN